MTNEILTNHDSKLTQSLSQESWFVYRHTSPEGKIYVGITKMLPYKRWGRGESYKDNSDFYGDIKKYGWDNFKHEIVEGGLTYQQALEMEDRLITLHNSLAPNGYNRRYNFVHMAKGGGDAENTSGLSVPQDYFESQKDNIKEKICRRLFEYLEFVDPHFSLEEYLYKKVKIPVEYRDDFPEYLPFFLQEVMDENREKILSVQYRMSAYKEWIREFTEENSKYIDVEDGRCMGTVYDVDDAAYFSCAEKIFEESFSENKIVKDFVFTVLDFIENHNCYDRDIEIETDENLFSFVENSSAWESGIETFILPRAWESFLGKRVFTACLDKRYKHISAFDNEAFDRENCRIILSASEQIGQRFLHFLEDNGAQLLNSQLIKISVADPKQYDRKSKEKIHYRLQGILKKLKTENPQQHKFIKEKIHLNYNLRTVRLSKLEELIYLTENCCSYKQYRYISILAANQGLRIKKDTYITKQDAQFIIPCFEKNHMDKLAELRENFF